MPTIDPDRVLKDLRDLAAFGRYKTGVHRPSLSPQDVEARHWFARRLEEAELEARIDGIANVIGYHRASGPKVLTGSHVESQNHAGWLDGPLGLVYGLEAARAIDADPDFEGCGVDVGAWFDEEAHFGSFLGSRSFVGLLSESGIDRAASRNDGTPLRDALAKAGFTGRPREQLTSKRYKGYMEAHIEQGVTLESGGFAIGIVTAIVGIWQSRIVVTGEQNHAGTTSMARRRDAGVTLVRILHQVAERMPAAAGPRSVWTTGRIALEPGAPSVIPGRAEALFQMRDTDSGVLGRMQAELEAIVAEAGRSGLCETSVEVLRQTAPAVMSPGLQKAIEAAAAVHCPGKAIPMPSAAGHDAQTFAHVMPAAMLFVPSIGGVSHHWTENTSDEDIVMGARVFVEAVARILQER